MASCGLKLLSSRVWIPTPVTPAPESQLSLSQMATLGWAWDRARESVQTKLDTKTTDALKKPQSYFSLQSGFYSRAFSSEETEQVCFGLFQSHLRNEETEAKIIK